MESGTINEQAVNAAEEELAAILAGLRLENRLQSGVAFASSAFAAELAAPDYLTPRFQVAGTYSNVFSISRSIKAEGYDELVGRNGGSADYAVTAANGPSWRFRLDYRYDGQPIAAEDYELRDGGRMACNDGKCVPYTDASGLIYNPALWGSPPRHLLVGGHWKVNISEPWELGGSKGEETITVIRLDSKSGTVTLMREARVREPSPMRAARSR